MKQKEIIKKMSEEEINAFKNYNWERALLMIIPLAVSLAFLIRDNALALIFGALILLLLIINIVRIFRSYQLELKEKEKITGIFTIAGFEKNRRGYKQIIKVIINGKEIKIRFPKFHVKKNDEFKTGDKVYCELTKVSHFPLLVEKRSNP